MIANPIIRKEVLSALRTRKAVLMQAAMLLVAAGLVWLLWPESGLQDVGGQQARRLLSVLAIGEMVMVALFAPAFTAASLTSEKEHNTWESLYGTALKPWEVALGKMVGSLAFLVLIVLTGVVAMAAPLLLGGVGLSTVLAATALLLLTAAYLGMIGLLVSTMTHRSYRAIITTYAILLVLCLLVALPAWPVSGQLITRVTGTPRTVMHYLASLSPLQAMLSLVLGDQSPFTQRTGNLPEYWVAFIPMSLAAIVATALACLYKLRRPVAPPRPREKLAVVERGRVSARSFLFVIDPRKRKRSIAWWMNPVLVKEFRTRPMLQAHTLLRLVGLCAIISVVLMFLVSLGVSALSAEGRSAADSMIVVLAALLMLLLIVIGPAMTSGAICADIETGVWDLLRTTRLPGWRIVSGKFQAAVLPLVLLSLALTPALVILLYFRPMLWPNVLGVLEVAGVTILLVATLGVFFSSLFKRTPTATAWTYGVVATLGLASLLMLLGEGIFSRRLVRAMFVVNPVAAAMDAAGHAGMNDLAIAADYLWIMSGTTALLLVVGVARVLQLQQPDK
ncbi:MAG: ABC transporter permease [Phycisphaerae bacterium]